MSSRSLLCLLLLLGCPVDEAANSGPGSAGVAVDAAGPPPLGDGVAPTGGGPAPEGAAPVDGAVPGAPPAGGAPPAEGGVPPADGAPAVGGPAPTNGVVPPADGAAPAAPSDFAEPAPPPGLASLIKDGKTVKVRGKLIGATKAQVDIQTVRGSGKSAAPELLETIKTTDGTFVFDAPATLDRPLYVTAMVQAGKDPKPDDLAGASDAIKLAGKDISIEITLSKDPGWLKKVPWGESAMAPAGTTLPTAGGDPAALGRGQPVVGKPTPPAGMGPPSTGGK